MRATIYTQTIWIELGMTAKDAFLNCLPQDKDGSFDTVQEMSEEIASKVIMLTDKDLATEHHKESFAEKLKAGLLVLPPVSYTHLTLPTNREV